MEVQVSSILFSILILGFTALTLKFLNWVWFRPKRLEKILRNQGLHGNSYRFLLGDIKDLISITKHEQPKSIRISDHLTPHILPYYHQIRSKYGDNSFLWFGPFPRLVICEPQLLKEILTRTDVFQKPLPDPIGQTVAGGLLFLEDDKWAKHRKIINPAFHMEKLKNKIPAIRLSCGSMIEKWEALFSGSDEPREIDVWPYLENLTGDVISRAAFGSSHEEGRRIFELQKEKVKLVLELLQFIFIPGWRFFPTKANKRMKAYSEEVEFLLRGIIDQRIKAMRRGEKACDDLLSTLLGSNSNSDGTHENGNQTDTKMSIEDVIHECRLFYFAGSETTSLLLVWTMVMLAKHQEWQDRAREEVSRVLSNDEPNFDNLNRLKIVTMILNEVLRLYPPAPLLSRTPKKPVKLGNINLPVGVDLILLIGMLHNDPKIWGDDANEFKPERFSDGISGATKGQFSFLPFGTGPKVCVGQHFAMMEAKLAMAVILKGFSFELSPNYRHAPFPIITLQPQHGVPLVLHKL
ncbi:Cytochrome P450 72A15 [Striga hermonthica]|uniref:Cytochrome P450 72A15 n=1 Tax=Striga hermonthica TaxID=68872 RepID=A0A9N7MY74_STRHE|nr:Cytochrome P450 72A15 [Striga hermonthica]